ncbi:MAG: ABC transporter substrate-binding protein [Opitutaceae bacterium]|nr:ABC transporter substrate-binding protein [Opitutaceae bacterium]
MSRTFRSTKARLAHALFALFATHAFSATSSGAEPIKFGEIESMTGKEAAFGQSAHKGIVLAVEEINAKGGLLGRPVVIVLQDNQSRAGESATIAKKLASRDKVAVVLSGAISSQCNEAGPVLQNAKVPFLATTATDASVTEAGNYVFRNCFVDEFQGAVMAKFARENLKLRRVALLTSASAIASVNLSKIYRKKFTALGGEIPVEQKYSEGDKDFRAQLTAIKASGADGLFVPGYYTEAALVCRQARDLGLNIPIFGTDGWEAPELVAIGGKAVEGTYYSTHYTSENTSPEVVDFVKKFRARFSGEVPDSMAPLAYDAALIAAAAITRAGTTDGPKVRAAIAATKDFPGITGRTTIDAQRNASKDAVIVTVRDGRIAYVETIEP